MKLDYVDKNEELEKKTSTFLEEINKNKEIANLYNEPPICIEFRDDFEDIEDVNTNELNNVKDDDAFCFPEKKRIYVKKNTETMNDDEYFFMLAHEIGHIYVFHEEFFITHKIGVLNQDIKGKKYNEELADYLAIRWGFEKGFIIDRTNHKGSENVACFVKDEKIFAAKISKFKNKLYSM